PQQQPAFVQGLVDQPEVATFEVAQPAVDEFGRDAAGAGGEIALVDQSDAQTAQRGVKGDARPGDAAAEDEQVKGPVPERFQRPFHAHTIRAAACSCQPDVDSGIDAVIEASYSDTAPRPKDGFVMLHHRSQLL